jgi:bifunctional enzyme CysN/CysC
MSALKGDNITDRSQAMPWYAGPSLMEHLESVQITDEYRGLPFRLPVQWVNRPNQDFRGFAGQIAGGQVSVGDRIRTLPSGPGSARGAHRHAGWRPAAAQSPDRASR